MKKHYSVIYNNFMFKNPRSWEKPGYIFTHLGMLKTDNLPSGYPFTGY